jgi:hypothetical protein
VILITQEQATTPENSPEPSDQAGLQGPAEGVIEDVAEDDLEHETTEHGRQQEDGHALSPNFQPT